MSGGSLMKYWQQDVGVSLVAQAVKNLPAIQETQVQSLGWEDPLEEGMAIYSSMLAWRRAWGDTIHGVAKESDRTE